MDKKKTTEELLEDLIKLVTPIASLAQNEVNKLNRGFAAEQALNEKIQSQPKPDSQESNLKSKEDEQTK